MELIKTLEEFEGWKEANNFFDGEAQLPREFPCWARMEVVDWGNEEACAVYYYRSDMAMMLAAMGGN